MRRKTGWTTKENITPGIHSKCKPSTHIDDLLSKLSNQLLAALSDLPEDVYDDSDEENRDYVKSLRSCQVQNKKDVRSAHLHYNESEEKVEDLAPDDVAVDPDDPIRAGALLEVVYPYSDRTEGVGQPPEWTTLLRRGQAGQKKNRTGPMRNAPPVRLALRRVTRRHTSRPCRRQWTELPQKRGRRGGQ